MVRTGHRGYRKQGTMTAVDGCAAVGDLGEAIAVTTSVAQGRPDFVGHGDRAGTRPPKARLHRGRLFGLRVGQLVATQFAAAMLLVAAPYGSVALVSAGLVAVTILVLTWMPMRHRWVYEWLGVAMRYSGRRHASDRGTGLLDLVAPGARIEPVELDGESAAVVVDGLGMTAVIELGDPSGLLVEAVADLPAPDSLLPTGADSPPTRVQVVLTGAPGPAMRAGSGTPANSYRQLTEGRILGYARSLMAIRVVRTEGWSEDDLRRALSSMIRKLPRRLGDVSLRALGGAAIGQALDELAHHSPGQIASESWPGLQVGGLAQATFRIGQLPDLRYGTSQRLVNRMLSLPASSTTVAISAGPRTGEALAIEWTVRLAAPDDNGLDLAAQHLRKLVTAERATVHRLDGDQLAGLAATLPLSTTVDAPPWGMPTDGLVPPGTLDGLALTPAGGGLMLGNNRHGAPVVARLFRPEQTRALLVGGVRAAQLVAMRAMALGARVVVQTARPRAWEPFVRGAAVPGESIAVVPPGRSMEMPPGTVLHPLLVVVDVGPVGADPGPGRGWQATLVVRDDFSAVDVDVASRADLLLLQPLRPDEANLAQASLGLGDAAQWLTRIRPDMIGVVNRRVVRWVALSITSIEQQLIGAPYRA